MHIYVCVCVCVCVCTVALSQQCLELVSMLSVQEKKAFQSSLPPHSNLARDATALEVRGGRDQERRIWRGREGGGKGVAGEKDRKASCD